MPLGKIFTFNQEFFCMKKHLLLTATFFSVSLFSFAQNVGVNTDGSAPSTLLHTKNTLAGQHNYFRIENTQSGFQSAIQLLNSGTAGADWIWYIPGGTTEMRLYRAADLVTFLANGNVGIGTTSPAAKLHIAIPGGNSQAIRFTSYGSSNPTITMGEDNSAPGVGYLSLWWASTPVERVRLTARTDIPSYINSGNVGIGISNPIARLDVQGPNTRSGTTGTSPTLYVSGALSTGQTGPASGNIEFRHDNGTQGIGFGYNSIYQTGSNASQELNLLSRGTSPITLNAYAYSTGNVGISTTAPSSKLQVVGGSQTITSVRTDGYVEDVSGIMNGNFIPSRSWTVSSGSVGIFNENGAGDNVREWGDGPHGNRVLLWKAQGASNADDGGWNTSTFNIDNTKTYRVSVWIKKTGNSDGTTYVGIQGSNITYLSGAGEGNPYFWCGDLPVLDRWYLIVGFIHGSGDASTSNKGGIYDGVSGQKVVSFGGGGNCDADFKFNSSATTQQQRAYLYYNSTGANRQYFWDPRFEEVNGRELPIASLLAIDAPASGSGNYIQNQTSLQSGANYNISGSGNVQTSYQLQGTNVLFNTGNDVYGNIRVLQNNSATLQDGMYINYNSTGGAAADLRFYANGTSERMHILASNGNVGIGTSGPSSKLHITGGGTILGTNGTSSNTRTLTILEDGDAQTNFGSYPGAWTSALQIQDNTAPASRFIWLSPLDNASGNNARFRTAGTGLDIYTGGGNDAGTYTATFATSGNVGIGSSAPNNKLEVYGSAGNYPARVGSPDGYLLFGPANSGWSHFSTDRARFYFNTGGTFDSGNIGSYDEDLSLQTSGTTRISVLNSNGNVGINSSSPGYKLEVVGDARTTTNHFFGTAGSFLSGGNQGGSIELGPANSAGGEIPFIDFHYGVGAAQDYNTRIINDANGRLNLIGTVRINGAYNLPSSDGSNGQVLTTNGSGTVSWAASSGTLNQGITMTSNTSESWLVGNNTGTYSTSAGVGWTPGTWLDVPNTSVTRTITAGNLVLVTFSARWETDGYNYYTPDMVWFRILRDDAEIARTAVYSDGSNGYNWYFTDGNVCLSYYDAGVAAGSHTWDVEFYLDNVYSSYTERILIGERYTMIQEIKP